MTILSKTVGTLSIVSCLKDMHETGKIYSSRAYIKTTGDEYIAKSIGNQKMDTLSYKNSKRKDWFFKNDFIIGIKENYSKIKGYCKGFLEAGIKYIPNFATSLIALKAKNKKLASIGALGAGIIEAFDLIKNSTNIFQKTDYLK